jgi:hypothetical protein
MRGVGGFYFYRFEHDELRKEQRLGRHALDGDASSGLCQQRIGRSRAWICWLRTISLAC